MSIEIKISKRRISYKTAMKILLKRVEKVKMNKDKELLWILEHPLTYTAGIRSNNNEIIDKKIKIINTNIEVVKLEILKIKTWFCDKDLSSLDSMN